MSVPKHIAIIMDGNGRWAKKRGLPRVMGHNAGMQSLKEIVRACSDLGVKYLTVYAFSTENWKRPEDEVNGIFKIMVHYIKKELAELKRENVKIRVVGEWEAIPAEAKESMKYALSETEENTGLQFNIALNYGGRREILDAVKELYLKVQESGEDIEGITEEDIGKYLATGNIPEPDMIIRTGGELRLSNFMLWQSAYSELIFREVYWPDFDKKELESCIEEFQLRHRRYGGLSS